MILYVIFVLLLVVCSDFQDLFGGDDDVEILCEYCEIL